MAMAKIRILCEGKADAQFFTRLASVRGITDIEAVECNGKSGFTRQLLACDAIRSLNDGSLLGILLAIDSDDDPDKALQFAQRAISEAGLGWPIPTTWLQAQGSDPSLAILAIPWHDRRGHLDSLIFETLQDSHADLLDPIQLFQVATEHRTGTWKHGTKERMRLRCLIAASHEKDPSRSLNLFLQSSDCVVDFSHPSLDAIADFLAQFSAQCQ